MSSSSVRPSRVRRLVPLVGALAALGGLVGCGQIDEKGAGVNVIVTTDDGARTVLDRRAVQVKHGEDALQVLQRATKVVTAGGGIRSIDGQTATAGRSWTMWLNGSPLRTGTLKATGQDVNLQQLPSLETAASTDVHDGDTVWFDLRPAGGVVPRGVVGTFPEPFEHGQQGKRWPVRVECGEERSQACQMVRDALVRYDIPAVANLVRSSYNPYSARIAVGTWAELRDDPSVGIAEDGAATSGILAVPSKDGHTIGLSDADGKVVRTLGAGSGAIFASRYRDEPPSWAVTGTDEAGVLRAAGALDELTLKNAIAVAITGGDVLKLPLRPATAR